VKRTAPQRHDPLCDSVMLYSPERRCVVPEIPPGG
jgi:hypothetical protein